MKKSAKIFMLILVAILSLTVLVACGGGGDTPNSNPDKARNALLKNGYLVTFVTDANDLEYYINHYNLESGCLDAYLAASTMGGDFIEIFYFKSETEANTAWDNAEFKSLVEGRIGSAMEKSDSMLWCATENAVKDAQ